MTGGMSKMWDVQAVERAAIEMRVQCGKSTDGAWGTLAQFSKKRWIKRAIAVLAAADGCSVDLLGDRK